MIKAPLWAPNQKWATRVVYLVNQKFKNHNLIDALYISMHNDM